MTKMFVGTTGVTYQIFVRNGFPFLPNNSGFPKLNSNLIKNSQFLKTGLQITRKY